MPTENSGRFVWYEHMTRDVPAAIAFYGDVVGWRTEPFGEASHEYLMWAASQGPLGGVMKLPEELERMGVPPHWTAYVQVEDVDATAARARSLGGKVLHEATDIPTVGRFAVIADPQGAAIALFRPGDPMTLHDPSKDGEFCWNELLTTDSAAALEFHSALFGWRLLEAMDMGPMGTYRVFGVGEQRLGGMMTKPKDAPMPPMWLYYASTRDLDGAIGRAVKRGGKVLNGPMEVPGGGRIAQLMDPQGGVFALHQAPRS